MATNAYLARLDQLYVKKAQNTEKMLGLPSQRPLNNQQPGLAGNPMPQQEQESDDAPQYDTPFGMNVQAFQEKDNRFKELMQEYTGLANGLSQAVKQGFMPEPIAKQRLESYLRNSQKYFANNAMSPMDNPQIAGVLEQMLAQASQMEGSEPVQQAQTGAPNIMQPQQGGPQ